MHNFSKENEYKFVSSFKCVLNMNNNLLNYHSRSLYQVRKVSPLALQSQQDALVSLYLAQKFL